MFSQTYEKREDCVWDQPLGMGFPFLVSAMFKNSAEEKKNTRNMEKKHQRVQGKNQNTPSNPRFKFPNKRSSDTCKSCNFRSLYSNFSYFA